MSEFFPFFISGLTISEKAVKFITMSNEQYKF
jgi:hypothetical protein